MKLRRPCGAWAAKLSPLSWAPGGSNGLVVIAGQNQTSPPLWVARWETGATFVGSWLGQRSRVLR
eukprot:2912457-Pyramimonas_sp.AAC.1